MLVSVGELNDNKNHEVIIKAISRIEAPIKYVLCGTGEREYFLRELAEKLNIKDKVIFAGYRSDIGEILKSADIFCFPSKREGLSVALMEAMASGLTCIVSKIRGNVDLIHDGKGGYLVESDQVDDFKKVIESYLNNGSQISMHGKYNEIIIRDFDEKRVNQMLRELYEGLY